MTDTIHKLLVQYRFRIGGDYILWASIYSNGREARLNQEWSHILKWKNAEEKNGFRNNCIIAIGISAIGIILAVLA